MSASRRVELPKLRPVFVKPTIFKIFFLIELVWLHEHCLFLFFSLWWILGVFFCFRCRLLLTWPPSFAPFLFWCSLLIISSQYAIDEFGPALDMLLVFIPTSILMAAFVLFSGRSISSSTSTGLLLILLKKCRDISSFLFCAGILPLMMMFVALLLFFLLFCLLIFSAPLLLVVILVVVIKLNAFEESVHESVRPSFTQGKDLRGHKRKGDQRQVSFVIKVLYIIAC